MSPEPTEEVKGSIQDDFELLNPVLSYDRFYPGRILGNTFTVKNVSDKVQRINIELSLKDNTPDTIKDHLLDYFEVSSLSSVNKCFTKHLFKKGSKGDSKLVSKVNSSREAWYLEDPFTKGLVRAVEIDLEP